MNRARLSPLLHAVRQACLECYGDRLLALAVFGSWARGAATPASDLDLLIVAEPLPRGRLKRQDEFARLDRATEAARAHIWPAPARAVELSPVFKTIAELRAGSPLYLDMTLWRIVLHDRDGVLEQHLANVAGRMAELGSRRTASKGGAYWDYKPTIVPGEVVEL